MCVYTITFFFAFETKIVKAHFGEKSKFIFPPHGNRAIISLVL